MRKVVIDLEVYVNYFLVGMMDLETGKTISATHRELPRLVQNFNDCYFIGFNSHHYDLRLLKYAQCHVGDKTLVEDLKAFSDFIITGGSAEAKKYYSQYWWDGRSLDLKEILGGRRCASLKKLGYRLHMPEIESLPIDPAKVLTDDEKEAIRKYNLIDLKNTRELYNHCSERLELRGKLTDMFGVDCNSLSDAQIAERVLGGKSWGNNWCDNGKVRRMCEYVCAGNYRFENRVYRDFLSGLMEHGVKFKTSYDPVGKKKTIEKRFIPPGPDQAKGENGVKELTVEGVPPLLFKFGGIHSVHKETVSGSEAWDIDVTSFYPNLILKHEIYPVGVGERFVEDYRRILDKRVEAKKGKRKTEADALKIVLNSTFGHFYNRFSRLFDPECGVSVCLNGELAILRLVDMCMSRGHRVLLANTDGIVMDGNPKEVVAAWEKEMGMTLEAKKIDRYFVVNSNNHVLRYADGTLKVKGSAFAFEPSVDKQNNYPIINKAVVLNLLNDTPVENTIRECHNVYEFLGCYSAGPSIREVVLAPAKTEGRKCLIDGDGERVSGVVRYYLSSSSRNHLWRKNAKTITRNADTEGITRLNKVDGFPKDVNFDLYIQKAKERLRKLL